MGEGFETCKCGQVMQSIDCWESGSSGPKGDYAYHLYRCILCGMLAKLDVWDGKGKLWIDTKNAVTHEVEEVDTKAAEAVVLTFKILSTGANFEEALEA